MADASSFDVTSTIDLQELDNAVNQARKEIAQRYDFKGSCAAIEFDKVANTMGLVAEDTFKMDQVWDVLQTRMIRRNVPVKNMKLGDVEPAASGTVRRKIELQQGISSDAARDIVKYLKEQKLKKVQANIQGDQLRITSPSKDELQEAMRLLRAHDFGVALQFGNYR
jgi:cyclic-di-GMP-binding protein